MGTFYANNGYTKVVTGLQNTLYIAIAGLAIGIIIGTVIAIIEVIPKYKRLPRVLNNFCKFYVGCLENTGCCAAFVLLCNFSAYRIKNSSC